MSSGPGTVSSQKKSARATRVWAKNQRKAAPMSRGILAVANRAADASGNRKLARQVPKADNPRSIVHYRAVKQEWNKTPKVRNAKKSLRIAESMARGKHVPAVRKEAAQALRTAALQALDAERVKGTDKAAWPVYKAYMDRTWDRVKGKYGGEKPHDVPNYTFEGEKVPGLAWANVDDNEAEYASNAARYYVGANRALRDDAKTTPLHEWTHLRQSPRVTGSKRDAEGGAEANARLVARELGLPFRSASPKYRAYRRSVERQHSTAYVKRGQMSTAKRRRNLQ